MLRKLFDVIDCRSACHCYCQKRSHPSDGVAFGRHRRSAGGQVNRAYSHLWGLPRIGSSLPVSGRIACVSCVFSAFLAVTFRTPSIPSAPEADHIPDCHEQNIRCLVAGLGFVSRVGRFQHLLNFFAQVRRSFNYDLMARSRSTAAAINAEALVKVPHLGGHVGN